MKDFNKKEQPPYYEILKHVYDENDILIKENEELKHICFCLVKELIKRDAKQ